MTAGTQSPTQLACIDRLIGRFGQKMESCTVMPDIVEPAWFPFGHVCDYPFYVGCFFAEARACRCKRRFAEVENGYIVIALAEEHIDEP